MLMPNLTEKKEIFDELYLLTFWIYSFLCIGLMVMLSPLVEVWLGKEYIIDQPTVIALVLIVYVSGLNFPYYTFRVTSGLFEPMKYNYVYFAFSNIMFSILLGQIWGLFGVYLATTVSRLITAEFKEGIIVYTKVLKMPIGKYFFRYFFSMGLVFALYALCSSIVNLIPLKGWNKFFVGCGICTLSVNLIYLLLFYRIPAFQSLRKRILNLFSQAIIMSYFKTRNRE